VTEPAFSFHFVDRIVELEPGRRARGTLAVPTDGGSFPPCMVVEAIGQLAAWLAIERAEFTRRPVAAIAGEVRVLRAVAPGETIDLEVVVRSCKRVAIAYDGAASVGGQTLIELAEAAGAMLPMADFEAPEDAQAHFARLVAGGVPPRRFPDRASFAPRVVHRDLERGRRVTAEVEAPPSGSLYAEHFPRRAVYPATLLLDAQLRLGLELIASPDARSSADASALVGARVRDVKVRAFTPPGGRLAITAEIVGDGRTGEAMPTAIAITATAGSKRASSATLLLPPIPR
jgi:3-hydroxymyristoyl/3-hydroxydecanoyl-(acyl carrier protein) dehydratase